MNPPRQAMRLQLFKTALQGINEKYGGEPRDRRRRVARQLTKHLWKEYRKQPPPTA